MTFTIQLGWWMIPAFLPTVFFGYAAILFALRREVRSMCWSLGIGLFMSTIAILTRCLP